MLSAIKKHLVPLGVTVNETTLPQEEIFGGYFIWINLPRSVDAEIIAKTCKEQEALIVAPGKIFEVVGDESIRFPNSVRLCFSYEDEEDLEDGVQRLARVVRGVLEGNESGIEGEGVMKGDLGEFK